MPIDPKSTTPGLANQAEPEQQPVHMKCKNPNCDSILALEMKIPGQPARRMYRCVQCGAVKSVMVGGAFEI